MRIVRVTRASVFFVSVGAFLTACAFVDTIVDDRFTTINRSTEVARNEAILLNIVRASYSQPLNFMTFSKVYPTSMSGLSLGAPSFLTGPYIANSQRQFSFGSNTLSGSLGASNAVDITVLDSKDFYNGLLSPVDLADVYAFERQGYSRELLFWLFADYVRVTTNGTTEEFRNEPSEIMKCPGMQSCSFRFYVNVAVQTGLTIETWRRKKTILVSGKPQEVEVTDARLCFDRVLAKRWAQQHGRPKYQGLRPRCGDFSQFGRQMGASNQPGLQIRTLGLRGPSPDIGIDIPTRSTFGVYEYLGRILAENATQTMTLLDPEERDTQLLTVDQNRSGGCFTQVSYNGQVYCVPAEGAENTKRIFSLLAQLLALKTATGDLQVTPSVRIIP